MKYDGLMLELELDKQNKTKIFLILILLFVLSPASQFSPFLFIVSIFIFCVPLPFFFSHPFAPHSLSFFHSASLFLPHPFPLVPLRFQHFDQDVRNRQRSSGDQAYLPPSIITKAKTKREVKSVRQPNSYQAHTCSENCATSDLPQVFLILDAQGESAVLRRFSTGEIAPFWGSYHRNRRK